VPTRSDYIPVDPAAQANAGVSFYDGIPTPLLGEQTFHGTRPFRLSGTPIPRGDRSHSPANAWGVRRL